MADVTLRRRAISRYGRWNRSRKADAAESMAKTWGVQSILLVGVSPRMDPLNNLIESRLLGVAPRVVASGLRAQSEDWADYVQADGRDLPFADAEFDLVFSNAVVEHVGGVAEQQQFVREHLRVGRHWILTTPNRLFPLESHTDTMFTHMRRNWTDELGRVTRLLSKSDLRELLPPSATIRGTVVSPTFTAYA